MCGGGSARAPRVSLAVMWTMVLRARSNSRRCWLTFGVHRQGGFPEEALHVLEEAEAGVGGVEMTVETYTAALQALARSDQHRHLVAEVYQRMSDRVSVAFASFCLCVSERRALREMSWGAPASVFERRSSARHVAELTRCGQGIVGTQVTGHILKKSESSRRAPSSSSSSS
eukprot:1508274-Rhodomonas_salina.1